MTHSSQSVFTSNVTTKVIISKLYERGATRNV